MEVEVTAVSVALARRVVTQVAPQELPLFPAISNQYQERRARPNGSGDERLGFGAGEVVTLLTPIILIVCTEVGPYLVQAVGETLKERGKRLISDRLDAWFGADKDDRPTFSAEQREEVRARAYKKARQLKLDADQAHLLADAIAGSLAIKQA